MKDILRTSAMLVLLLSLCVHVTSGACPGGRSEGDKWFDGCRWCMCQDGSPHCSSSECSELNAILPPCLNYGSRWWDGCYQCVCHSEGIDCTADRACVVNPSPSRDRACLEPQDDRCVCGVDGVPSCTADAIDRNALKARTISIEAAPYTASSRLLSSKPTYYRPPTVSPLRLSSSRSLSFSGNRHGRYRTLQGLDKSERQARRGSEGRRSSRRRNGRGGRRRQGERNRSLNNSRPRNRNRSRLRQNKGRNGNRRNQNGRRLRQREVEMARLSSLVQNDYPVVLSAEDKTNDEILRELEQLEVEDGALSRRRNRNRNRNRNRGEDYDLTRVQDEPSRMSSKQKIPTLSGETPYPPSLLVTTDNRCRWGMRWYGGGLRCYCDRDGSITCGDPSFVAPRIDGFVVEKTPCEEGYVWEDSESCRFCECQTNGVSLCRRSESCPLPFLVKPVDPSEEGGDGSSNVDVTVAQDKDSTSGNGGKPAFAPKNGLGILGKVDETGGMSDDADAVAGLHPTRVVEKEVSSIGSKPKPPSADVTEGSGDVDKGAWEEKPSRRPTQLRDPRRAKSRGSTVVKVVECQPGKRWVDGCLRCFCDSQGKKHCDDRMCPRARPPPPPPTWVTPDTTPASIKTPSSLKVTPLQTLPKNWSTGRKGPVNPGYEVNKPSCGPFKVGQHYWIRCNLCVCTKSGPRCSAMNC